MLTYARLIGRIKADILVMENLFWGLNIEAGRTFDLKGIAGRKVRKKDPVAKDAEDEGNDAHPKGERRRVKPFAEKRLAPATHKPLFDNEWLEGTASSTRVNRRG